MTYTITQDEWKFRREPWRVSKTITNEFHNGYSYTVAYNTLSMTIYRLIHRFRLLLEEYNNF